MLRMVKKSGIVRLELGDRDYIALYGLLPYNGFNVR